jgi:hypothetical protein
MKSIAGNGKKGGPEGQECRNQPQTLAHDRPISGASESYGFRPGGHTLFAVYLEGFSLSAAGVHTVSRVYWGVATPALIQI